MQRSLGWISSLFVLLAGITVSPGCSDGGGNGGTGDGDGDAPGDGDGDGDTANGDHFTPPSALTDRLADEEQVQLSLDRIASNDCDVGFFRIDGQAGDVSIGQGLGVGTASFSNGPGVETFNATAGAEMVIKLSWSAGTAAGATTLTSGWLQFGDEEICFDGVVCPRADVDGASYIVLNAATLYEATNGVCSASPIGDNQDSLEACIATVPSP